MKERIKGIYNDCWMIYKQYLGNHNMKQYNDATQDLMKKYDYQPDICNLLIWWSSKVNALHDEYTGR